jgi:hypothetical protein
LIGLPEGTYLEDAIEDDPFDLKISVSPHGGIDKWQWTLSIGNGAPIETGVVNGSRMDGIRAAREERLRLIGKAIDKGDTASPTGTVSASAPNQGDQGSEKGSE